MFKLGKFNKLKVLRSTSVGLYLGDEDGNDVLLPNKYVKPEFQIDDIVEVFVYKDYEQRWIATTLIPYIKMNQFAFLKVKSVSVHGAFLDWGLEKDLFVPFKEQTHKMNEGKRYVVYMYKDEHTDRIVATMKLNRYLSNEDENYKLNEKVNLLIFETTPLGFNAIINHKHKGLLYHSELQKSIRVGEKHVGYIKAVREDNGIDLSLEPLGMQRLEEGSEKILNLLQQTNKKFIALTDKSSPEDIYSITQMSKKTFKSSIGILYKMKRISLDDDGIRLLD